jgi:hypothetical protein
MYTFNRKQLLMPLAAFALSLAAVLSAAAATCEDFRLSIKNSTADEIKVKRIQYRDGGDWLTENALGADGFKKIEPGHVEPFTRNFQRVGGETTRFRITYAHHHGGSEWDDDLVVESSSFTCTDNGSKTVTLTQ